MAPEQIRGASGVDLRADLYSFAMVVFEMSSGRLAHDASGQIAMIASKLERAARSLREVHRVSIPAGLDALLARCLSRKPEGRPASAEELLRAWQALGPATVAPRLSPLTPMRPIQVSHAVETQAGLTRGSSLRAEGSTRLGLALAAGALLAASVVLVIALRANGQSTSGAGAPAQPSVQAGVEAPASTSTQVSSIATETSTSTPTSSPATTLTFTVAASASPSRPPTRRRWGNPPSAPAATAPSGPHISVQPRY